MVQNVLRTNIFYFLKFTSYFDFVFRLLQFSIFHTLMRLFLQVEIGRANGVDGKNNYDGKNNVDQKRSTGIQRRWRECAQNCSNVQCDFTTLFLPREELDLSCSPRKVNEMLLLSPNNFEHPSFRRRRHHKSIT